MGVPQREHCVITAAIKSPVTCVCHKGNSVSSRLNAPEKGRRNGRVMPTPYVRHEALTKGRADPPLAKQASLNLERGPEREHGFEIGPLEGNDDTYPNETKASPLGKPCGEPLTHNLSPRPC